MTDIAGRRGWSTGGVHVCGVAGAVWPIVEAALSDNRRGSCSSSRGFESGGSARG